MPAQRQGPATPSRSDRPQQCLEVTRRAFGRQRRIDRRDRLRLLEPERVQREHGVRAHLGQPRVCAHVGCATFSVACEPIEIARLNGA